MENLIIRTDKTDKEVLKREINTLKTKEPIFKSLIKAKKKYQNTFNSHLLYAIGLTDDPPENNNPKTIFYSDDLPDIDIDFQDDKRELAFDYLKEKYGASNVAKLGTLSLYKPKNTLNEVAKVLDISVESLKQEIPETDAGDKRLLLPLLLDETEVGQEFQKDCPEISISKEIEGHCRHNGVHAAAALVSSHNIYDYCTYDAQNDIVQIDKNGAERLNLLKIDCLGLSCLTIINNCLNLIGKDRDWLLNYSLDDKKAFEVLNKQKPAGIFQFEGRSLRNLSRNVHIDCFNDAVALTSLARPATLVNGEAERYIKNKQKGEITYQHELLEPYLKETYGVIVYQEQVMQIVKELGDFTWEETSFVRKAIGKSKGSEYIDKMKEKFVNSLITKGVESLTAYAIWKNITDMGAYAFNKSHAVAYTLLSYQCMVLKAYHPLEFALSCLLKNSDDKDKTKILLKELVNEGYVYKAYDPELSDVDWTIQDGVLIGGFKNIDGIGKIKAREIVKNRKNGELTSVQSRSIYKAKTAYDVIFDCQFHFKHLYDNWREHFKEKPVYLIDIKEENRSVKFVAKLIKIKIKDVNSKEELEKRNGEKITKGCLKKASLIFQDDTDEVRAMISRDLFEKYEKCLELDAYYKVSGNSWEHFRFVFIDGIKKLDLNK
jgi:DNA polymerase-3 subunit alpha